jgi:DNA processing protein
MEQLMCAASRWDVDASLRMADPIAGDGERGAAIGNRPAMDRDPDGDAERDAWVVLLSVTGLGPVSFAALLEGFGSARAVLGAATSPGGPERLMEALADAATATEDGIDTARGGVFDACAAAVAGDGRGPAGIEGAARRRPPIGADLAARICDAAATGGRATEQVRALGLAAVTLEEPSYPLRLRLVELPPPLLFVRGSVAALNPGSAIAVVGTRWPTDKGRVLAGWIGSALARCGSVVVSGLAVGIDGAAHASVVAEGGTTVAVLGGGHARLFPKAHERLADAIVASGGAIVSELAPDTSPSRGTFPRRNRLVSGLSDATVVVEAGRRSGALITAGWALEQGRECFLVPGQLDSPSSAGCNAFLRSFPGQARVVCGVSELVEDLDLAPCAEETSDAPGGMGESGEGAGAEARRRAKAPRQSSAPGSSMAPAGQASVIASLGPAERALATQLVRGPATADQLALKTAMAPAAVLSALTLLELRGLVTGAYGRYSPSGALASWSGGDR